MTRRLLLGMFLASTLCACSAVEPWERGRLAKPHMAAEPAPSQRALREHVYQSREASQGGTFSEGHGCGCY